MTADERLVRIGVKIQRAKKHIVDLDAAVGAFIASNPYGVVKQINPQTGKPRYVVDRVAETPAHITAIFGDIIQNLRSALDHLTNQLLLVHLRVDRTDEEFNFPIFSNAKKHEATFLGKEKPRISADAWRALRSLQTYKGGDGHNFWVLNCLNNINKHRMLLLVGGASHSMNLGSAFASMMFAHDKRLKEVPKIDMYFKMSDICCPLKSGDVLVDLDTDMEMDPNRDFVFHIAINEPHVIEDKPIIQTAMEFTDLVIGTVQQFRRFLM